MTKIVKKKHWEFNSRKFFKLQNKNSQLKVIKTYKNCLKKIYLSIIW